MNQFRSYQKLKGLQRRQEPLGYRHYRIAILVACVKFSNLDMALDDAGGEPPVSVTAVAARWIDRLQLLEVELDDGVQLLGQRRPFEAGRQVVEPGAIFVL